MDLFLAGVQIISDFRFNLGEWFQICQNSFYKSIPYRHILMVFFKTIRKIVTSQQKISDLCSVIVN
jgi:hypothetical protein